ncbi:MAG: hypothetical protein R3C14_13980 [Caldilineaceae bacterium]
MENWAETQSQLDQVLAWERALARQRRQQQWQQLLEQGKRLQALLMQPWFRSNQGLTKTLVTRRQRTVTTH